MEFSFEFKKTQKSKASLALTFSLDKEKKPVYQIKGWSSVNIVFELTNEISKKEITLIFDDCVEKLNISFKNDEVELKHKIEFFAKRNNNMNQILFFVEKK